MLQFATFVQKSFMEQVFVPKVVICKKKYGCVKLLLLIHPVHFQFILTIEGRGGKFNLKNTILNIGSGLALLGVTTVICDFLLMYIKEKRVVKMKK